MESSQKSLFPEKQKLLRLEAEGKYVFHGSSSDLKEAHPQQAVDVRRGPEKHGPAIHASTRAETAIFYALKQRGGSYSEEGSTVHEDGTVTSHYGFTKAHRDAIERNPRGYVYVFNETDFAPRSKGAIEYITTKETKWVDVVPVHKRDLPDNIKIIED